MTYTNKFNRSPYFDDFEESKNYHKILFKPELSIQTREINQIQTILQNNTSKISDYLIKNNAFIEDGTVDTYKADYIKIDASTFDYNDYTDNYLINDDTLLSRVISGVNDDGLDLKNTLYIKYLNSTLNNEVYVHDTTLTVLAKIKVDQVSGTYVNGDTIIGTISAASAKIYKVDEDADYIYVKFDNPLRFIEDEPLQIGLQYNATFKSMERDNEDINIFDNASVSEPIGKGRLASVEQGLYYFNGYFLFNEIQTIVVEPYNYMNSYSIGLEIEENTIDTNTDPSLSDNAAGYPNANAPGADRYQINPILKSYELFVTQPENFFTIVKIVNDNIVKDVDQEITELDRKLADRTYEESGNYIINQPSYNIYDFDEIYPIESLAFDSQDQAVGFAIDKFNIDAAYEDGGFWYPCNNQTELESQISDNYLMYVEPNTAYVKGLRFKYDTNQELVCRKSRDFNNFNNATTIEKTVQYIILENVSHLPNINTLDQLDILDIGASVIGTLYCQNITNYTNTSRLFVIEYSMNSGKVFSEARSVSFGDFTADIVLDSGEARFYNTNSNLLINSRFDSVRSISDLQIIISNYLEETADGSGNVVINAGANEQLLPYSAQDYVLTDSTGSIVDLEGTFNLVGGTLTIQLGAGYANQDVKIIYNVLNVNPTIKTKSILTNSKVVALPTNEIDLDHVDIYKVTGIYDSGDINTPATNTDADITRNYNIDDGQRKYFYGFGKISLKENFSEPTGQILIEYEYFSHSVGDCFINSSYPVDIEDIPSFVDNEVEYQLNDSIDFRQIKTLSGYDITNKTANIANEKITTYDVEYYLPRKDIILIDSQGSIGIKYGYSNVNPKSPTINPNNIPLFSLSLKPYIRTIKDVVIETLYKRRYTMSDIGDLESRIVELSNLVNNLRDEILYNDLSTDTLFVDNFTGLIGDVDNNAYSASVDLENNELRAYSKTYNQDLNLESQNNIVINNNIASLPYTEDNYLNINNYNSYEKILKVNKDKNNIYLELERDTINSYDVEIVFKDNTSNKSIDDNDYIYNNPVNNWIGTKDE